MDYEVDIRIDETSLDVEWLDQPQLMLKYARHAAKCRKALDLAKEAVDVTRAEMDKAIRKSPESYGIEKVTETAISSAVLLSRQYSEAYHAYLDAKYETEIAVAAVTAVEQRKSALEALVRLHGQQYFAGPQIPRDLTWEREQKGIRANAAVGRMMRKK
jgi:hypothetical protein